MPRSKLQRSNHLGDCVTTTVENLMFQRAYALSNSRFDYEVWRRLDVDFWGTLGALGDAVIECSLDDIQPDAGHLAHLLKAGSCP